MCQYCPFKYRYHFFRIILLFPNEVELGQSHEKLNPGKLILKKNPDEEGVVTVKGIMRYFKNI